MNVKLFVIVNECPLFDLYVVGTVASLALVDLELERSARQGGPWGEDANRMNGALG